MLSNTILCGDVVKGMEYLKTNGDKFNCVYADPDYNVGIHYNDKVYNLKHDEYIDWTISWSKLGNELLTDDGNMFIMNYPKNNAYLRVKYLDNAFYDVRDYSWVYNTNVGHSSKYFTTAHRSILHCRKSKNNRWFKDHVAEPYKNLKDKRIQYNLANGSKGRMPYSWFYHDLVKNVSKEKTAHACQIPEQLSSKLFSACMNTGDRVLVLFGGSGSEVSSALKLGLNYVTIEKDPQYCKIIQDRSYDITKEKYQITEVP